MVDLRACRRRPYIPSESADPREQVPVKGLRSESRSVIGSDRRRPGYIGWAAVTAAGWWRDDHPDETLCADTVDQAGTQGLLIAKCAG
jgi:hypothetical protein